MKLASLKPGLDGAGRDGRLMVVSPDLASAVMADEIAPTLQAALDNWPAFQPALAALAEAVETGGARGVFRFDPARVGPPLPRAYQWLDGSAYLRHVELVRRARGAEMSPTFMTDPLMYQGGSDHLLGPTDPIEAASEDWGIDFESEIAVVTGDVPMGVDRRQALGTIRLIMLANDVSLRNLIPTELAKGFGFVQSKPASAFSPVAVTPDAFGPAWHEGKLKGRLLTFSNDQRFGDPDAGIDMNFDFGTLIAHAAKTRRLAAGTIVGSGTVANRDPARGSSCIAERRAIETIEQGRLVTPFLAFGERVRIEMRDAAGASIFGAIEQTVVRREQADA